MTFDKRLALSFPIDAFTLAEHAAVAQEMEGRGYRDAWSFEVDGTDCFTSLAAVAQSTNLRLGTAIANVYTRGPATLAMHAASLAELAPGRFVLGIGSGSQPVVESWNSMRFARPATRVREMALFLRQALANERVVFEGETFQVDGFRLSRPVPGPVPIHVAGLRPGMLRVAGEVADGVCVNWLSAEDVKRAVAVVREAAAAAGRDPAAIEVTARLMVHVDPVSDESDLVARRAITGYLTVPVYEQFHRWLGRDGALGPMWDAWKAGDRRGAVAAIPEATVGELLLRGTAAERRAHIERYFEAGVDTAFLNLTTAEQEPARRREVLLRALREMAPAS